jgi:predicted MFS family arabinose efflux permease
VLAVTAQYRIASITIIAMVLWGFAWSTLPMLFQAAMLRAVPTAPDPASAILFTCVNVAISTGSFIGGKTLEHAGITWIPVLAGICMLGAVVVMTYKR